MLRTPSRVTVWMRCKYLCSRPAALVLSRLSTVRRGVGLRCDAGLRHDCLQLLRRLATLQHRRTDRHASILYIRFKVIDA